MDPALDIPNAERLTRVRGIVDDCFRRMSVGEPIDVCDVMAAHRDLPELASEIRKLALIRDAVRSAGTAHDPAGIEDPETDVGRGSSERKHLISKRDRDVPRSDEFPGYKITDRIAHGGQGVVYDAVEIATGRRVALKVLLDGQFASPRDRRRFEREIEFAASLQHPCIAPVLFAGQTTTGRLYFAMEYCAGVPINAFVRNRRLTLNQALALMAKVCDGVHHAHQRGVIHRDLKPSNILVAEEGSELRVQGSGGISGGDFPNPEPRTLNPQPKILDFGLARSIDPVNRTETRSRDGGAGTVPYMAPEQVLQRSHDIDVRTDVYALGVLLYEMLTGGFPYPVDGALPEVVQNIAHAEPASPRRTWTASRGVSGEPARPSMWSGRPRPLLVGATTAAGGGRSTLNGAARCPLGDEVCTIVLKALAKDRARRYQTAGDLAADLRRLLAGEPIEAKRDRLTYRFGKWSRRHAGKLIVGTALVVLAGVTTTLALRDAAARDHQQREQWVAQLREASFRPLSSKEPSPELSNAIRGVWSLIKSGNADVREKEALAAASVRFWFEKSRLLVTGRESLDTPPRVCIRRSLGWVPTGFVLDADREGVANERLDANATADRVHVPLLSSKPGLQTYRGSAIVRFLEAAESPANRRELGKVKIPIGPFPFLLARSFPDDYPYRYDDPSYREEMAQTFAVRRAAFVTSPSRRSSDGTIDMLRIEFVIPASPLDVAFHVEYSLPGNELYGRTPFAIQSEGQGTQPITPTFISSSGMTSNGLTWECWFETPAYFVAAQTDPIALVGREMQVALKPSHYLARNSFTSDIFLAVEGGASITVADERNPAHRVAAAAVYPLLARDSSVEAITASLRQNTELNTAELRASLALVEFATGAFDLACQAMAATYEPGRTREVYERAAERARMSVELEPRRSLASEALGVALYRLGRFDEAIPALERASEIEQKETAIPVLFRAMCAHRQGDSIRARSLLSSFRQLRSVDPGVGTFGERAAVEATALIEGN